MTPTPQRDPVTGSAAAALLGLSRDRALELIRSGELPSRRVGRTYWVQRSHTDTWIAAHALTPGQLGPTCAGRPRRSNLHAALAAGWDLPQLSAELDVTVAKIERWHNTGVPNPYVQRLRDLTARQSRGAAARTGCPLRRREQARTDTGVTRRS